jgi:predicted 3-demethylubiquinone-9 3-methyltransferase (glyoxalase superfamily)
MNKISTWMWFNKEAEEAAKFYVSIFRNARLGEVTYASAGGEPHTHEGQVLTAAFEIEGQHFYGLNGGPIEEKPNFTMSTQVLCADQAEVDHYWNGLLQGGGKEVQCGWVTDKYGYSWQIVPEVLLRLTNGPDRERAARVTAAMMKMIKLDVAALEAA